MLFADELSSSVQEDSLELSKSLLLPTLVFVLNFLLSSNIVSDSLISEEPCRWKMVEMNRCLVAWLFVATGSGRVKVELILVTMG